MSSGCFQARRYFFCCFPFYAVGAKPHFVFAVAVIVVRHIAVPHAVTRQNENPTETPSVNIDRRKKERNPIVKLKIAADTV